MNWYVKTIFLLEYSIHTDVVKWTISHRIKIANQTCTCSKNDLNLKSLALLSQRRSYKCKLVLQNIYCKKFGKKVEVRRFVSLWCKTTHMWGCNHWVVIVLENGIKFYKKIKLKKSVQVSASHCSYVNMNIHIYLQFFFSLTSWVKIETCLMFSCFFSDFKFSSHMCQYFTYHML